MKILYLAFCFVLALNAHSQKLKDVKVGPEEEISLKVPEQFRNMSDQDRMKKSYSSKVPLAFFANESQEVTLGINYNIMRWTEKDTDLVYGFYKASINNLFDEIEFMRDEITEINGRQFIVFEFVGSVTDENTFVSKGSQKNYHYIQYTSWNNQVLIFNLGCRSRYMGQWQPMAEEIMQSVKIK